MCKRCVVVECVRVYARGPKVVRGQPRRDVHECLADFLGVEYP